MTRNRNIGFALYLIVLLGLTSGLIRQLVTFSLDGDTMAASHIMLVPFVTFGLLFANRKRIFDSVRLAAGPGVLVVAVGAGVLVVHGTYGQGLAETERLALASTGIVVSCLGGFLLFYGTEAFRKGAFPLFFLCLAVPLPTFLLSGLTTLLQRSSAEVAYFMLQLTGTPVYREGFVFAMPNLVIEIAPECSGIRSSIGMFILSLLAGHFFLRTAWKRALLVVSAIVIGVVKNAIRIDTLSLLTIHVDPGFIEGRLHHEGGVVFFALGLMILYPVLAVLARSESPAVGRPGDVE